MNHAFARSSVDPGSIEKPSSSMLTSSDPTPLTTKILPARSAPSHLAVTWPAIASDDAIIRARIVALILKTGVTASQPSARVAFCTWAQAVDDDGDVARVGDVVSESRPP